MNAGRTPIIAGNWKMYKTVGEARSFCRSLGVAIKETRDPLVLICPAFTALFAVVEELAGSQIRVGAQNCDFHDEGAFTGEISPRMVADMGCQFVLLGHSERRLYCGESDGSVNKKVHAALAVGLVPIICVGERTEEREVQLTDNVVIIQVQRALLNLSGEQVAGLVFAYEPVWAIGTGKTCEATEANRIATIIRETVARQAGPGPAQDVRILYGGSVKPETIALQMAQPEIDGALVGGASLDAVSFGRIAEYRKAKV